MGKFRKKPVVIEAIQLNWGTWNEVCDFLGDAAKMEENGIKGRMGEADSPNAPGQREINLVIHTLEGDHLACENDWIIRGVKGEFYSCKPDIFEATYEPVGA